MKNLNLNPTTESQKVVKAYLEQNASDTLADKINNGAVILKDGLTLINQKTLDGFMKYATSEAQKMVEKGSRCACIQDDVVFGWAIHYFEEDSIEENLFNLDGTKYSKVVEMPKKKAEKKTTVANKPISIEKIKPVSGNQISFF